MCWMILVIVDYLQLMQADQKHATRLNEITEISRNLKLLAKELNVPVIALSQLSRAIENRKDKKPMLSDLRESGSIEQDADAVIFIHRDSYYLDQAGQDNNHPIPAELLLAKNRAGQTGTIKLTWMARNMLFKERSLRPEPPAGKQLDPREYNDLPDLTNQIPPPTDDDIPIDLGDAPLSF